MAKISVIVPVYNVSMYIEQCLTSLMKQTFSDIEIIVVDDCGQDDSMDKVEKLAQKDKRIKIVRNKTNKGLAEARNIGLKYVKSEFVGFLDSDDWVCENFFEKLYKDINRYKADIAVSDVLYYRKEEYSLRRGWVSTWNFKSGKKIVKSAKDKQFNIYACACWNKLYKTSLFKDYDIKFPKGLKIEDVPVTTITTMLAKKIVMVKDAILYYRQREDSIMAVGRSDRTPFDIFNIYAYTDSLVSSLIGNKLLKTYQQIMDNFKIFNIYTWYTNIGDEYKQEFYDMMKEMFARINIKHNPFISKETKNVYNMVVKNKHKPEDITTCKLFNFLLLGQVLRYNGYTNIYLCKSILLDKIVLSEKNSLHYLFGFIPILTVKRK